MRRRRRSSGQNGSPNGQPPKFSCAARPPGWNEYGSRQGAAAVLELVADEPEVVLGLQVVAGRRLAVARGRAARGSASRRGWSAGQVAATPAPQVERADERYKARAAASSSSKSGTSAVS